MILIIDRFEEEFAVCEREDKTYINIPKYKLPENAKENDMIYVDEKMDNIIVLEKETDELKNELKLMFEDMWE